MNSTNLICSLAGRYDNPILSRFLAPIDCLKIPAQEWASKHSNPACYEEGTEVIYLIDGLDTQTQSLQLYKTASFKTAKKNNTAFSTLRGREEKLREGKGRYCVESCLCLLGGGGGAVSLDDR